MEMDGYHSLSGQLHAVVLTMSALIEHLPPAMAGDVAGTLAVHADVQCEADDLEQAAPAAARERVALLDAMLELLRTVQRSGPPGA